MRLPAVLVSETRLSKPGLGTFYVHAWRWRPGRIQAMGFQPEHREVVHPVPEPVWQAMADLAFGDSTPTYEQIMALIRQEPDASGG